MALEVSGELLPELKKPRLHDEESKSKNENEEEDAYNSDDSDFYAADANGYHEMNSEEYRIYDEAVAKSRGFDVPEFPKVLEMGLITPVCLFSNWYGEIELCAEFALEEHNKAMGKKYKLHKLVKANMAASSGTDFYITFVAEDLIEVGESEKSVVPAEDTCGGGAGGGGESEKVGPSGGPLVEFEAQTYIHLPDEQENCKIEVFYFGAKESQ